MTLPSIFFISLMLLGNYMLLNLFLAILLKFISENGENEDSDETKIETPKNSGENPDSKAIGD